MFLMTSGVFANDIANEEKQEFSKEEILVKRCCIRTASDGNGNSWTARRCFDHRDSAQAFGAACALAQADTDKAKKEATHDTTVTAG